jgi:hypothetical protein
MAEYLTGLTDEEVRARAEGVAGHVAARLCELLEQGEFIATAQQDVEDPDLRMEIFLRQRDIAKEISTLSAVGGILGIVEQ